MCGRDWSSDVCSSDLTDLAFDGAAQKGGLDYDWRIVALERSVDRINPN